MFRVTDWRPRGHDWSRWLSWFASIGVQAEVRVSGGECAIWRDGDELPTRPETDVD